MGHTFRVSRHVVRETAAWLMLAVLVWAYFSANDSVDTKTAAVVAAQDTADVAQTAAEVNRAGVTNVERLLARACATVPEAKLRVKGLADECRLATAGDIEKVVPVSTTPQGKITLPDLTPDIVEAVNTYFEDNPVNVEVVGLTKPEVAAQVTAYIAAHPDQFTGPPGADAPPVTQEEVAQAVAVVLTANPPKALASANVDAGCFLVLNYNDGTTDRLGPICGGDGANGTDGTSATQADVQQAVMDYCTDGRCTGPAGPPGPEGPAGPPGYPASFTYTDPGLLPGPEDDTTYTCTDADGDHQYNCS